MCHVNDCLVVVAGSFSHIVQSLRTCIRGERHDRWLSQKLLCLVFRSKTALALQVHIVAKRSLPDLSHLSMEQLAKLPAAVPFDSLANALPAELLVPQVSSLRIRYGD